MIDISIIIVSYNTRAMLLDCLDTLRLCLTGLTHEVFVVDNASSDGSAAAVRAGFPDVHLIENTDNRGFGAASNIALQEAQGEFLLLLNSDAFPEPNAVKILVQSLQDNPKAGIAGPRLLNQDGSLQPSCYRFPSPSRAWLENLWVSSLAPARTPLGDYRRWAHDTACQVDWVSGACFLVRRDAYAAAGGFDEQFFMYQEETDWQKRIRDNGWQVLFSPDAKVMHLGGASGAADQARINRHFFDSLDRYEWKHHGPAGLLSVRLAMMIGCALRTLLWLAVLVLVPRRRPQARAKARLASWLLRRQATHWNLNLGKSL